MKDVGTLTHELVAWHSGDPEALDRAWMLAYEELKSAARYFLATENNVRSLSATTLIHDAFLKFKKRPPPDFQSRSQFFCFASKVVRNMIIDHFRRQKVRGVSQKETLDSINHLKNDNGFPALYDLLEIDDALNKLEKEYPRRAQITLLRYYAGFNLDEIADLLDISTSTVKREWRMARMWFAHHLTTQPVNQID